MNTIIPNQQNFNATIPQKKFEEPISEGAMRFIKATQPELDEVTMILRCHLLAEYYLDKLIVAFLPRGDILTDGNRAKFMFNDKLTIISSFSIFSQHLIDSLYKLNSIRNTCGHELEYTVTENDINKIGNPFGIEYLKLKEKNKGKNLLQATLMLLIARIDYRVDIYIKNKQT